MLPKTPKRPLGRNDHRAHRRENETKRSLDKFHRERRFSDRNRTYTERLNSMFILRPVPRAYLKTKRLFLLDRKFRASYSRCHHASKASDELAAAFLPAFQSRPLASCDKQPTARKNLPMHEGENPRHKQNTQPRRMPKFNKGGSNLLHIQSACVGMVTPYTPAYLEIIRHKLTRTVGHIEL